MSAFWQALMWIGLASFVVGTAWVMTVDLRKNLPFRRH